MIAIVNPCRLLSYTMSDNLNWPVSSFNSQTTSAGTNYQQSVPSGSISDLVADQAAHLTPFPCYTTQHGPPYLQQHLRGASHSPSHSQYIPSQEPQYRSPGCTADNQYIISPHHQVPPHYNACARPHKHFSGPIPLHRLPDPIPQCRNHLLDPIPHPPSNLFDPSSPYVPQPPVSVSLDVAGGSSHKSDLQFTGHIGNTLPGPSLQPSLVSRPPMHRMLPPPSATSFIAQPNPSPSPCASQQSYSNQQSLHLAVYNSVPSDPKRKCFPRPGNPSLSAIDHAQNSLSGVTSAPVVVSTFSTSSHQNTYSSTSESDKHTSSQLRSVPCSSSLPRSSFNLAFEKLIRICPRWHNFGLALGLSKNVLDRISNDNHEKCEPCLREVLALRIRKSSLTWREVIVALSSPTVLDNELAEEVESEFIDCLDAPLQIDSVTLSSHASAGAFTVNPPDCVVMYASFLKSKYKCMSILPDTWPPPLAGQDHFTNLALIERRKLLRLPEAKSKHSIEYDYAYGNVDNIVERKQAIKLEDLFKLLPGENFSQDQFIILMDGAPGVGKTTISRKICKDWSENELGVNFNLVILLPLRELIIGCHDDSNFSLADLVRADDPELKDQVVKYLQKTSGTGVLFIFDGFDELGTYHRTKQSLFLDIVKGNKLHCCSVLITSRTYASGSLKEINHINRHVEVLGFKKQQINSCIRKNITDKDKAKQLLQMLKERLDIVSLCYIPLNCRIVLYVYQQQYTLPDTLTQLYEVFILYTIKHYAEKISATQDVDLDEVKQTNSVHSLPSVIIKNLDYLSHIAYAGMLEDKLVFEYSEIKQSINALSLGLLNMIDTVTNCGEEHYYQFLHFTLQEFLAAWHVKKTMTGEEKLEFLKQRQNEDRFRITLLFLSGLTGLDFLPDNQPFPVHSAINLTVDNPRFKRTRKGRAKFLFLAQILYESNKSSCDCLVLALSAKVFDFSSYSLSYFDCIVLANFFSLTPEDYIWDSINLSNCHLTADCLQILLCKHHSKKQVPIFNTTTTLDLGGNSLDVSISWLLPLSSEGSQIKEMVPFSGIKLHYNIDGKLLRVDMNLETANLKQFKEGSIRTLLANNILVFEVNITNIINMTDDVTDWLGTINNLKQLSLEYYLYPDSPEASAIQAILINYKGLQRLAVKCDEDDLVVEITKDICSIVDFTITGRFYFYDQLYFAMFQGMLLNKSVSFSKLILFHRDDSEYYVFYTKNFLTVRTRKIYSVLNFVSSVTSKNSLTELTLHNYNTSSSIPINIVFVSLETLPLLATLIFDTSVFKFDAFSDFLCATTSVKHLTFKDCDFINLGKLCYSLIDNLSLKELLFINCHSYVERNCSELGDLLSFFSSAQINKLQNLRKFKFCVDVTMSEWYSHGRSLIQAVCNMIIHNTVIQELTFNCSLFEEDPKMFLVSLSECTTPKVIFIVGAHSTSNLNRVLLEQYSADLCEHPNYATLKIGMVDLKWTPLPNDDCFQCSLGEWL